MKLSQTHCLPLEIPPHRRLFDLATVRLAESENLRQCLPLHFGPAVSTRAPPGSIYTGQRSRRQKTTLWLLISASDPSVPHLNLIVSAYQMAILTVFLKHFQLILYLELLDY